MGSSARVLPALAVVPLTALLISSCAGGGAGRGTGQAAAPPMRLVSYDSCQELLNGLRAATEKQVGPYGLGWPMKSMLGGEAVPLAAEGMRTPAAPGAAAQPHSATNVQEAGVDEPDMVKTDGRRIVVLAKGAVQVIDAATRKVTGTLTLTAPGGYYPGLLGGDNLLLSGDRALVIAPQPRMLFGGIRPPESRPLPPRPIVSELKLFMIDLSGPTPKLSGTLTFDGTYIAARQVGTVARIVAGSEPHIDFPPPRPAPVNPPPRGAASAPSVPGPASTPSSVQSPAGTPSAVQSPAGTPSPDPATEANRQAVRQAPLSDWLPQYDIESGGVKQTHQVPCEQVSHPPQYSGTSMLTVLTIDLSKGLADPQPISVVADGQTVYASATSLYVSHTGGFPIGPWKRPAPGEGQMAQPVLTTDLYKFDISGSGRPHYLASGSVPGTLLSQYSMSEYAGNLQVAATSAPALGNSTPATTSVYVLGQHGPKLDMLGSVGGLGKGERVYAVRFLGKTGYVVTFRQMDPLYTLDLHDPAHPAVQGELTLNGYSAYLHPITDGRLLGVGQDATAAGRPLGTQVSLFDVTGKDPKRITAFRLPDSTTEAQYDPHAFLYWPQSGLTVLPVTLSGQWAGEVLALTVTASGVHQLGTIRQPGQPDMPVPQIHRSLIIGGTLWTFSDTGAQANDASTLARQAWLPF